MKCEHCRWWDSEGAGWRYGFCRVDPPTINPRSTTQEAEWPLTIPGDWCGKFERIAAPPLDPTKGPQHG